GRAVAALGGEAVHEGALQRMEIGAGGEAGGGGDRSALDGLGEGQARELRLAVDEDRAGAAGALSAAELRGEVPDATAQHVEKVLTLLDEDRLLGAVEAELEGLLRHRHLRSSRRRRWTPTTSRRYQPEARLSVGGSKPSAAARAAASI